MPRSPLRPLRRPFLLPIGLALGLLSLLGGCGGASPRPAAPRPEADEIPARWSDEDAPPDPNAGDDSGAGEAGEADGPGESGGGDQGASEAPK